jgi:hypothetical protein
MYGTCSSPEQQARAKRKRAENERLTGYAKSEAERAKGREHYRAVRTRAVSLYGGACECCGESRYDMLTFDHKEKARLTDKVKGVALTYEVIREAERSGYPNGKYRLLCWNCNMSRGHHGYCPHEQGYQEHEYNGKAIKLETIAAYGSCCVLCGEAHWELLTIDHINGGGAAHRRSVGNGRKFYTLLKRLGWPRDEYRLLCANCNCSTKANGWSRGGMRKLGRV